MDKAEQYWPSLIQQFGSWEQRCLELMDDFRRDPQGLYPKPYVNHPLQVFHFFGRGAFGSVAKAIVFTDIGYALKFISNDQGYDAMREAQNVCCIPKVEGLVKYYGHFQHRVPSTGVVFTCIGMELCDGNLNDYLKTSWYLGLTPDQQRIQRWEMLRAIAGGLEACHNKRIMHRDIKPDNILYRLEAGLPRFKLGDFGIARPSLQPGQFGSLAGDKRYIAPEVCTGQYNEYADMYMLGMTMKEIYDEPSNWSNLAFCLLSQNPTYRRTAQHVRETAEDNLHYLRNNPSSSY